MGYWGASLEGMSLQLFGDLNPDGGEMLWGDAPADCIDTGLDNLITRLTVDLGRYPSIAEVDAVKATAPEMLKAVEKAKKVFAADIERPATDGEIAAGLAFSDTEISLDCHIRRDIHVGDTVRWAVMRNNGMWSEIDHLVEGTVIEIKEEQVKSDWSDSTWTRTTYEVRREDSIEDVRQGYCSKVLPTDDAIEVANVRYLEKTSPLTDD